jgi:FeS assembly SUF system regulator
MLKLSRLTDYGTVVLAHMARAPDARHRASELALATHLGEATVRKLLKLLTRGGIVVSQRGAGGGYTLARPPDRISAVEVIDALEGPVALTECSGEHHSCEHERGCALEHNWQQINRAVREALRAISLAELARPRGTTAPLRFHPAARR